LRLNEKFSVARWIETLMKISAPAAGKALADHKDLYFHTKSKHAKTVILACSQGFIQADFSAK
jgi:hypothetical protein